MGDLDRPRDRDRSRSPRRDKKPKISGGFKWKEKKPARDDGEGNGQETRSGRVGGYRDRDDDRPRRRKDREEDEDQAHSRDKERRRDREQDRPRRSPLPSAPEEAPEDPAAKEKKQDAPAIDNDILSKFGASAAAKFSKSAAASTTKPNSSSSAGATSSSIDAAKSTKNKERPAGPRPGEPMILVKVNDRLGTAAQIPCFASDNVGLFKAQVAAKVGRRPHEILLKRQGERPFKDVLTLEDYGVSNGVQIDLELAT